MGGQLLSPEAGPQDNRAVEARPDVLVFTSAPLRAALDVLGPVEATLHLRASTGSADIFARLCDVDPEGQSRNVTDGILRIGGEEHITVPMSSTAYQFAPGHRLRLQVSGGAFPRFARNTGTAEPLGHLRCHVNAPGPDSHRGLSRRGPAVGSAASGRGGEPGRVVKWEPRCVQHLPSPVSEGRRVFPLGPFNASPRPTLPSKF